MKRAIFSNFTLVLSLLVLNACGTNSKSDGGGVNTTQNGATPSIACFYDPDTDSGPEKYVLNCYVHTVDSNSNPINGLEYTVSVITNLKASNTSTTSGTILTTDPITFSDDAQTFVQSDIQAGDTLIIVPSNETTDASYLGNWQIASVNSNTNITLRERAFNLETTEGLSYYIGSETRYDLGGTANAHIQYPDENNVTLNTVSNDGLFFFTVVFDYRLEGETALIGVHTGQNRIGTASFISLVVEEEEVVTDP